MPDVLLYISKPTILIQHIYKKYVCSTHSFIYYFSIFFHDHKSGMKRKRNTKDFFAESISYELLWNALADSSLKYHITKSSKLFAPQTRLDVLNIIKNVCTSILNAPSKCNTIPFFVAVL